jgi:hypothetical protein
MVWTQNAKISGRPVIGSIDVPRNAVQLDLLLKLLVFGIKRSSVASNDKHSIILYAHTRCAIESLERTGSRHVSLLLLLKNNSRVKYLSFHVDLYEGIGSIRFGPRSATYFPWLLLLLLRKNAESPIRWYWRIARRRGRRWGGRSCRADDAFDGR